MPGLFLSLILMDSLLWGCAYSKSGSGQEGCEANVSISTSDISVVHVPPGTVCIECVFDGVLATDAEFQIDNQNINESVGRVDDGVLVVYDTENVFSTSTAHTIKCTNADHLAQALVLLAIFRPPVITGETTINEGDMLDLDCDVSTSSPLPTAQWFSPQGDMISNSRDLEVMNIQRSAMGVYICMATQFGTSLNNTINVTVQFFRHPVITGATTLNEGDTLNLDCNVSTSSPLPSVQWFSPQGDMISNNSDLEIISIQSDNAGIYTCVTTRSDSGATLNTTVNVTVLSIAVDSTSMVYVVVLVVTFVILMTLLAVVFLVICWKYFLSNSITDLPKNRFEGDTEGNVAYYVAGVQTSDEHMAMQKNFSCSTTAKVMSKDV